jgi:hypothetical protein
MSVQQLSASAARAQDVAFGLHFAKASGDCQAIAKYLPQAAANAMCKFSKVSTIVCGHHGTRILLQRAFQGPCPCTLWCEECAESKRFVVRRASELAEGPWPEGAEDPYVCGACETAMPCGHDFVPLEVSTATRMASGVRDVLDEVHLLLVDSEQQDPVDGIGVDAANAERARRNGQRSSKRDIEWFREKAREDLGDDASEEDVSAHAEEALAAHEEKKAAAKEKALSKKRDLARVPELEAQLRDTTAKLARSERLYNAALTRGHEIKAWNRGALRQELEAIEELFGDEDGPVDEPPVEAHV